MLDDAERLTRRRTEGPQRPHATASDHDDLAGIEIALEGGADQVEGTALAGSDPGPVQAPERQRAEAMAVAGGDQGGARQHDDAVGALHPRQGIDQALLLAALARAR